MELYEIPDIFQSKLRLMIVSALLSGDKSFRELKEITGASDGNLSVQISNMENGGYVQTKKSFFGKRPMTTICLTPQGKQAFMDYLDLLNHILNSSSDE